MTGPEDEEGAQEEVHEESREDDESAEGSEESKALPPASFTLLLRSLELQAHVALGDIESPITGKSEPDRDRAKFQIDMFQVIEEKTKGNLSPEEETLLRRILFDLRMRYLSSVKRD